MGQLGFLIIFITTLMAGYTMAVAVPESFATMLFGIGLIALATVGRKTLVK